ncbi:MAG: hypothetical protein ACXADH_02890 [Candidatus Kariarchaeaceae archaeon]|jgi:hypothetical protein
MTTFYHYGSLGDIVYSLPAIEVAGGGDVWMHWNPFYRFMKPLLLAQPCVNKVELVRSKEWGMENADFNFFNFRYYERKARAEGRIEHLAESHLLVVDKQFDLTKPWLHNIKADWRADIVICRTQRYHDPRGRKEVDWHILKDYNDRLCFVGEEKDYLRFKKHFFDPVNFVCRDCMELAEIVKGAKLLVGNQSLPLALAEAMKINRIYEVCYERNNCRPFTPNGHTKLTRELIERYIEK